jgi:hypothetical protein
VKANDNHFELEENVSPNKIINSGASTPEATPRLRAARRVDNGASTPEAVPRLYAARRGFLPQAQAAQQLLKHASLPPSYGQVSDSSKVHRRVLCSSARLPSAFLLLQQRSFVAENDHLC